MRVGLQSLALCFFLLSFVGFLEDALALMCLGIDVGAYQ